MKKLLLSLFVILIGVVTFVIISQREQHLDQLQPRFVKVPEGQIEYYQFGQGSPLILITGYLSSVKSWNIPLLQILAQKHEVIVFDNRNVGGSHFNTDSYTSVDLAQDTYALIKALHFNQVDVAGISMGGIIAQQLAILHPQLITHLILINTLIAGMNPTPPDKNVEDALMHPPQKALQRYFLALHILFPANARFKMAFITWYDRFNPHYKEARVSSAVAIQQVNLVFAWTQNTQALKALKTLPMPILILSGGADQVIPPANSDILLHELPHAQMVRWQNGGHAMIYQYPEAIGNTINQFLNFQEADHTPRLMEHF